MKDCILKVYLQPKSSKNEIVGPYRDGIKVKVTAPPVEGKANEALIRLLARELKISPSHIEILKGLHSREKTVKIDSAKSLTLQLRPNPGLDGRDKAVFRVNPERPAKPGRRVDFTKEIY
jgi:uncharacterized protein (TIGR00251 family)